MNFSLPLLLLAALSGAVSATVVNIDFNRLPVSGIPTNTYVGLGAAPDLPTNTTWNGLNRANSGSGITGTSLLDSAGLVTSVSISIPPVISHGSTVGDQELGPGDSLLDLMSDNISIDSGAAGTLVSKSGTLAGLVVGGLYDIYFYGQGDDNNASSANDGQNSLFAITSSLGGPVIGTAKQTGYDGVPGGNEILTEGVEYVKFTATANSLGQIFFTWENVVPGVNVTTDLVPNLGNTGSPFASLNGIQIVAVPEPSVALLGAFGLLSLLRRRR